MTRGTPIWVKISSVDLHQWINKNGTLTAVLCAKCTQKEYANLYMRREWSNKDYGKKFKCDHCGCEEVIS